MTAVIVRLEHVWGGDGAPAPPRTTAGGRVVARPEEKSPGAEAG